MKKFIAYDKYLLFYVVSLSLIGVLFIHSASYQSDVTLSLQSSSVKQIFFLLIGFILMAIVSMINYKKLAEHSTLLFFICLFILLYTLIFGKVVNSSKRWISIGDLISLQPSEFAKILMIIVFANFLDRFRDKLNNWIYILIALFVFFLPATLVFLQPDLGTAIVFIPVMLMMFFIGGLTWKYFLAMLIIGGLSVLIPFILTFVSMIDESNIFIQTLRQNSNILFVIFFFLAISLSAFTINIRLQNKFLSHLTYFCFVISIGFALALIVDSYLLKDYQRKRLLAFIDPELERWGMGYNVIQSQITVGSGRLIGKGWLGGTQGQLGFLPARSTDFIFSVVGEEVGFIGSLIVILLFFLLISRLIKIAKDVKDHLGGLITVGIATMFAIQIVINIGMTIGVAPVTGLPLPFLTSGGSTLWASLIAIGIVLNIEMNKYVYNIKGK